MRALAISILGLLALAMAWAGAADARAIPAKHFSLVIQGRYAKRWVTVYKDKGAWVCATEGMPYFAAHGDPLADFKWADLGRADKGDCRDTVVIEDRRSKPVKTTRGCLTAQPLKDLVAKLDQRCRAE